MQISVFVFQMFVAVSVAKQGRQVRTSRSSSSSVCFSQRRVATPRILSQRPGRRILNGVLGEEGQFPFLVGVYWGKFPDWEVKCTATIISPTWVLTGSHCFLNDTTGRPYLGLTTVHAGARDISTFEQFRVSRKVVNHLLLDVGLLRVDRPFKFTTHVTYIPLSNSLHPYGLKNCIGIGYGATGLSQSGWCNFLPFWIRYRALFNCSLVQRKVGAHYHVCASAKLSTQQTYYGDSGGPLVCDGVQVGVLTGLFARDGHVINKYLTIAHYLRWIQGHVSDLPETVSMEDDTVAHEEYPHTWYSDLTWWLG